MTAIQTVAPMYGPKMPLISFFAGRRYLGCVPGLPNNLTAARANLANTIRAQAKGMNCSAELALIASANAELSCGAITVSLA